MGRERKLCRGFLAVVITTVLCLLFVSGCTEHHGIGSLRAPTDILLCAGEMSSRAAEPDCDRIRDANIFVFSSDGFLERSEYIHGAACSLPLVYGRDYDIYACVNFGYKLNIKNLDEINALVFHIAYPDDYSTGMPMCGAVFGVRAGNSIRMPIVRMMAELRIGMDRSRLKENVKMDVRSLRIGNCPRRCRVFSESGAGSSDDCFSVGFSRNSSECEILNKTVEGGRSAELSLYMLENIQGDFPREVGTDSDKVLEKDDHLADVCSYIEMELGYHSPEHYSNGGFLKYRFYLGESRSDLNVRRNCLYHITVAPDGDGLNEDSWRIDRTFLSDMVSFSMKPDGLVEPQIGDEIHVRCSYSPAGAPFKIGLEELEEGRARGVFNYAIDEDWHGVKLSIVGPGDAKVYMEAGAPISQAGLLNIHVKKK